MLDGENVCWSRGEQIELMHGDAGGLDRVSCEERSFEVPSLAMKSKVILCSEPVRAGHYLNLSPSLISVPQISNSSKVVTKEEGVRSSYHGPLQEEDTEMQRSSDPLPSFKTKRASHLRLTTHLHVSLKDALDFESKLDELG